MATSSFFEDMIIDSEEAAQALWDAFEDADKRETPDVDKSKVLRLVTDPEEIGRILKW